MKIIITGCKASGKSTIAAKLEQLLKIPSAETDSIAEDLYFADKGVRRTCREIWEAEGDEAFRQYEVRAAEAAAAMDYCIVATGGGTMMSPANRRVLRRNSIIVMIKADEDLLWQRMCASGLPPFYTGDNGKELMSQRAAKLYEAAEHMCDIVYTVTKENEGNAAEELADEITCYMELGATNPNTFGDILRATTFGESHGRAVGVVLDGVMPGLPLSEGDIQEDLDRRRPGQSSISTQRNEADKVIIVSGVFEGKTTGTPVCMLVVNENQNSSHYDELRDVFRPGHADFTFWKKYGVRDHRGGGRSSGRETIGRVAAGAVAKKILKSIGIEVIAYTKSVGLVVAETEDYSFINQNPVRTVDRKLAPVMEEAIIEAKNAGDTLGGTVCCVIRGVPAGIGDPVFGKLDARLASAFFSVGAVKSFEVGMGLGASVMLGSRHNDEIKDGRFASNNAGGVLGGISTGQDIILRAAVKPTPSIKMLQHSMNKKGENADITVTGRHDPCIVPRIVPVLEAMAALVVLDCIRIQEKIKESRDKIAAMNKGLSWHD